MSDDPKSFVHEHYDLLGNRLREVSEFLWSNPELSGEEDKAHDFLTQLLESDGFIVERQYLDISTSFRATFEVLPGQ